MARARSDKSLARFDRIALVLSGGSALGAYQAGAYAALENSGVRPNWIAGTAIGALFRGKLRCAVSFQAAAVHM